MNLLNVPSAGTPYRFPSSPPHSFDCWTLVAYIRQLAGEDTVLKAHHDQGSPESMEREVEAEAAVTDWVRVPHSDIRDLDVVLMGTKHVGVYFRGLVGHAIPDSGVTYHAWRTVMRSFSRVQVYRP